MPGPGPAGEPHSNIVPVSRLGTAGGDTQVVPGRGGSADAQRVCWLLRLMYKAQLVKNISDVKVHFPSCS